MARKPATKDTPESPKTSATAASPAGTDEGAAKAAEQTGSAATTDAEKSPTQGPEATTLAGGDDSTPSVDPSGLAVVVIGPKRGFRRIGRTFGAEAVTIPLDDLTEDEKAALIATPALTVTTVPATD